jgi:superfamily I DNA/RNA helicase
LKTKINRENTDIKTLHSLGFSILRYNFNEKELKVDEQKYQNKLTEMLIDSDSINAQDSRYISNILKLCDFGRYFLIKKESDLIEIANKYNIIIIDDEVSLANKLIDWGKNSLIDSDVIDYTDMIYLPNVLNVRVFKYDFIIIDEAQDLSISQMALFMKCFKQGSRFISVGDEKQCINSFAGSDINSFNKLKGLPNTINLPLSISYRCPKKIVRYAQSLVPEIQHAENAIDGYINFNSKIEDLIDGDMVICRNTGPLIKLYVHLITNNVKCYLKGNDVGLNLLDLINDIQTENLIEMFGILNEMLKKYVNNRNNIGCESIEEIYDTQSYGDLIDKIDCLKILSKVVNTKTDLINKIKEIFSDENKQGVCLSTIHKSKGLEADNVYILNKNLTPSK